MTESPLASGRKPAFVLPLRILFGAILAIMLGGTIRASRIESVWKGGDKVLREPWGVMTLIDAYFGFITFYAWVAYKERRGLSRLVWFVLIMTLGNIAMSGYMLKELFRLKPDAKIEDLLLRRTD